MPKEQEEYPNLNLLKEIAASTTIFFCFILIITYFISFLQVKFKILVKEDITKEIRTTRYSHSSFLEQSGLQAKDEDKQTKKIGLGSHYMFYLILSHFFGGIAELIYIIIGDESIYKKGNENHKENFECQLFGFFHNFFDLSSVCWTTMLTYLFYKSTNLSSEILYKDNKYLFIGFLYWFLMCGVFCVIPLFQNCYGFASTYCAFRKGDDIKIKIWSSSFIFIVLFNSVFNIICLFKTTIFYSKKLKLMKSQDNKEYKLVYVYVKVFQIFPIVLVITRLLKLIPVLLLKSFEHSTITKVFIYLNGFGFNINGALNSLACIYFFRGVFWCCCSSSKTNEEGEDKSDNLVKTNLYESADNSNEN